ncbi:MAG: NAD-dependent epimerase/dehydratase family protein, partial [Desulfomonilia bacterium]|nr:NAD-dependent epimerase/dehydratase family protein [Desulfomonilia bacterium]
LWAALKSGVERVVFTSSIAALGVNPSRELSSEDTPFNQYTLGNHYVLTKYLSQQEALGFANNGLDLVVVNPCFPFGPNDSVPTPTGQVIVDILKGISRASFNGGLNIVDVRDVARGHVLAALRGRSGTCYILGNRNIEMGDFIALVCSLAGFGDRKIVNVPVPVMKAGTAVLKWFSDHVTHRPPLSSPPEIAYASQYLFFDNTRARTELGLEFRPVEDSLKESIAWFRDNGYA